MQIERASDDVYVFTSERYAQVTATLIVSGTVGVMIDTLPFPNETAQIAKLAQKVAPDGVRYLIYTQHQADHVFGSVFFPRAEIIAHSKCRDLLIKHGYAALEAARKTSPDFQYARIKLPGIVFDTGTFTLRLPNKTLDMNATPGHTPDSISVLLQEEKILFAGDTVMALPTFTDGDPQQLMASISMIAEMPLDSVVQGHGEIILKGEIKDYLKKSTNYIEQVDAKVRKLAAEGGTRADARKTITIESCGMQRVMLNGQVAGLHTANVMALWDKFGPPDPAPKPVEPPKPVPQIQEPKARPAVRTAVKSNSKVAALPQVKGAKPAKTNAKPEKAAAKPAKKTAGKSRK